METIAYPPHFKALLEDDDFPGMPFGGEGCWFPDVQVLSEQMNFLNK